jgi:predicted transcriptional regulator
MKITKIGDKDRRHKITDAEKQQAITMRQSGMTLQRIANELGYSLTTIHNAVNPEAQEKRNAMIRKYKRSGDRYKDKERRSEYARVYQREYYHKKKQELK